MKTINTRVTEDNIRAEVAWTSRPAWADENWDANWYNVTLIRKRRRITVPFGMGLGLTDEPDAATVLNSLLSDAAGMVNARGFEDWAREYGYDEDLRKAESTYRLVANQTDKLRNFLRDDFDEYVFNTEPD